MVETDEHRYGDGGGLDARQSWNLGCIDDSLSFGASFAAMILSAERADEVEKCVSEVIVAAL
jgi:hypothetical protein